MNLNYNFNKLIDNYSNIYSEVWKEEKFKHPFGEFIRNDIPISIYDLNILDRNRYTIKASCGVGRWTPVPWIAVFDTNITKRARDGVYIVYLLNKDTKTLYLTLNQATYERKLNDLKNSATEIRNILGVNDLQTQIDSGSKEYDAACIYGKSYTIESLPDDDLLREDLEKFLKVYDDYYNKIYLIKQVENQWWPSLEEYDPGISKETWLDLLNDGKTFTQNAYEALAAYYDFGGEGTCSQIADEYGRTPDFYRMSLGVQLAEKVQKTTNCPKFDSDESKLWPTVFVGRNANSSEHGSFVWKIRDELSEALKEFDILDKFPIEKNEGKNFLSFEVGEIEVDTTKQTIEKIKAYVAAEGFTYPDGLVENFYLSLKSKPFVILAGTSGTGKTRLVKLFAEAVGATKDNGRYQLVAVRPDWSDSSDLFGHVDLNGNFVKGAIIDFVKKAELDKSKPYFLCLDEMNLARVEYYLSDFLSIIETRDFNGNEIVTDPILESNYFGKDSAAAGRYGTIRLPENLYIIGTVNMDETTFPFSKKVLDRANTIEFSYVDLIPNFEESLSEINPLNLDNKFLKTKYLRLMQCAGEEKVQSICVELDKINKILEKANAHIGYRVRDEIVFYMLSNDELLNDNDAFDNEIMQKILPRIQGSSVSIKAMLCDLFKVCAGDYDGYQTEDNISGKMLKAAEKADCKYKKSAKKIAFMVRRFEEDGFTSYWL